MVYPCNIDSFKRFSKMYELLKKQINIFNAKTGNHDNIPVILNLSIRA